jgi:putative addiction module killer protein
MLMLKNERFLSSKFVKSIRDGLFELRIEYQGNIYRIFFIFDDGNIVILFNGFQKKSQKTPTKEIDKALRLKQEYYERKKNETL